MKEKKGRMHWRGLVGVGIMALSILGVAGCSTQSHQSPVQQTKSAIKEQAEQVKVNQSTDDKLEVLAKNSQAKLKKTKSKYNDEVTGKSAPNMTAKLNRALNRKHFVGTALVVKNNKVVFQKGYGYADYGLKRKNTAKSLYQINSVQKSLTAILVMKAEQKGLLSLDDKLNKYYPQLKNSDQVTLRQMLDMHSGITGTVSSSKALTEDQMVNYGVKNATVDTKRIGQWSYAPINYLILSGILTKVTHQSYYKLYYNTLINPLKLHYSGFMELDNEQKTGTKGYGGPLIRDYQNPNTESPATLDSLLGTGNAYMSDGDLYQAERAVVTNQIVSQDAANNLHGVGTDINYAGGLYRMKDNSGYYSHGVGNYYESTVAISPDGKDAVVLMSNYFEKRIMDPVWSTEQTAIDTYKEIHEQSTLN
ncbi:serine hydrolase domain-containing protein [Levilactobacillus bambusae]|uniref:serine hydrolase domain-containing protein n=1 Tax=Levilactobacillus bambusae TaxID=2024736 RepID=UPI001403468A|nr:serine hydrolase domain-containing protein [Levilactobacillus bambusae]